MPSIFGDGMVLQRDMQVFIWGNAKPGTKISIKGSWPKSKFSIVVDSTGYWKSKLTTGEAGGPHTLEVRAQLKEKGEAPIDTTIIYEDVLLGDVWLCSGQSNMEWPLHQSEDGEAAIQKADNPNIRLFKVERKFSQEEQKDCSGAWETLSPETARNFSAVAQYFGGYLNENLEVPIGLVQSAWGGTPVEAWTRRKRLERVDAFQERLAMIDSLSKPGSDVQTKYQRAVESWNQNMLAMIGESAPESISQSAWKDIEIPSLWESTELGNYDGTVWFQKRINIPEKWAGKDLTLHLGPIDDMDLAWFDGNEIGRTLGPGKYTSPRVYTIPANLVTSGDHTLLLRVIDTGGGGGLWGKKEQLKIGLAGDSMPLAGTWQYQAEIAFDESKKLPPFPRSGLPANHQRPSVLFNGMIKPLQGFGMKGVIWYQGESNVSYPESYEAIFSAMIQDWRSLWNIGDFAFMFVQIAPYDYGTVNNSAFLREAQARVAKLRNTGMAITMDIGNPKDIHPRNKAEVGRRLGLLAHNTAYGYREVECSGPVFEHMRVTGNKAMLYFNHTYAGLEAKDGPLTHFEIAGSDKVFYPAKAVITGASISVTSEEVAKPVAVRYGWSNTAEPNLYNSAGLPASSFRTDKWE